MWINIQCSRHDQATNSVQAEYVCVMLAGALSLQVRQHDQNRQQQLPYCSSHHEMKACRQRSQGLAATGADTQVARRSEQVSVSGSRRQMSTSSSRRNDNSGRCSSCTCARCIRAHTRSSSHGPTFGGSLCSMCFKQGILAHLQAHPDWASADLNRHCLHLSATPSTWVGIGQGIHH